MRSNCADSTPDAGAATSMTNSGRTPSSTWRRPAGRVVARRADGVAVDVRRRALDRARQDVHAGRADEIADERMGGRSNSSSGVPALNDAAVMHDDDRVGEGQRLGLVVRDVDHREVELAMQLLEHRPQLPLQMRDR